MKDVAGEALRVDADDGRLRSGLGGDDVAHHQGDRRLHPIGGRGNLIIAGFRVGDDALEAEDAEVSPACGEVGIGELAHGSKGHTLIIRFAVRTGRPNEWRA